MKVLNLFAGIGGNRRLWGNVDVTAVELDSEIAAIYQDFFPGDTVVVADAHQYLLEHYNEYDFIWSSPPCPTHSRIRVAGAKRGQYPPMYPDFMLWQEVTFLEHYTKDVQWVVENVDSYYTPIVSPTVRIDRHCFWASFFVPHKKFESNEGGLIHTSGAAGRFGVDISGYKLTKRKDQVLRNQVNPEVGKYIFDCAMNRRVESCGKQQSLF